MSILSDCCETLNPCEVLCALQNVQVKIALGKQVKTFKIGDETFSMASVSASDLSTLIAEYQQKCDPSSIPGGLITPKKRRFNGCFVHRDSCFSRRRGGCS